MFFRLFLCTVCTVLQYSTVYSQPGLGLLGRLLFLVSYHFDCFTYLLYFGKLNYFIWSYALFGKLLYTVSHFYIVLFGRLLFLVSYVLYIPFLYCFITLNIFIKKKRIEKIEFCSYRYKENGLMLYCH